MKRPFVKGTTPVRGRKLTMVTVGYEPLTKWDLFRSGEITPVEPIYFWPLIGVIYNSIYELEGAHLVGGKSLKRWLMC